MFRLFISQASQCILSQYWVGGVAVLLSMSSIASAQQRWSITAAVQAHGSRSEFVSNSFVNPRLWLRPTIGFAGILGLNYHYSPRLGVEVGIGPLKHGVTLASLSDYQGGRRFENLRVTTAHYTSPQVHFVLKQWTRPSATGHRWLLEGGVDAISRRYTVIGSMGGRLSTGPAQPPAYFSMTNQPKDTHVVRFGIRVGAGREWEINDGHFYGVKLLGSMGLHDFIEWQLDYTYTENGITNTYSNSIRTRLGYVGVQTWYRLRP